MSRIRVSTTVDADLLHAARQTRSGGTDASLMDAALSALLASHRAAQIDVAYDAYDSQPLSDPDEWGDLASWRDAAGSA